MTTKVSDVVKTIEDSLLKAKDDISTTLSKSGDDELIVDKGYYLVKNKFWDKWLQKILAQLISVKVWCLAVITVLIFMNIITGSEFIIGFSLIIGAKGSNDLVMKLVEGKEAGMRSISRDIIDKV